MSHALEVRELREGESVSDSGAVGGLIAELNPMLRGWFEYFKHAHVSSLRRLDGFIRRRIRAILRLYAGKAGRHGHSLNDHKRWPDAYFARQGLFTLAGAHAAACRSR